MISWEELKEIEPRVEGQKKKKDFVPTTTTFKRFMEAFGDFFRPKFCYHHQQSKIMDDDIRIVKELALLSYQYPKEYDLSVYDYSDMPELSDVMPDTCADIEDFSENWKVQLWKEHQSRYWVQIGVTLFGMVLFIHIDNVRDITQDERTKLKKLKSDNNLPPIVIISCIVVSADLTHDAASVFHYNDHLFTPWLLELTKRADGTSPFGINKGRRIRLLDGATHFKSSGAAFWTSSQHEKGPKVENCYHATAHAKDLSDSECGGLKNMADREQGILEGTGGTSVIKTPEDLYNFAQRKYHLPPSHIYEKTGRGIYRRHFFYQPATGPN